MTKSLQILMIEDNADSAKSMSMLLEMNGHSVQISVDGPSGLEQANSCWPDVVLLDIGLPGMTGYEIAKTIRASEHKPQPTIIALTGYGTESDRKESYRSGIDFHFVKPVDPQELYSTLNHLPSPCQWRR